MPSKGKAVGNLVKWGVKYGPHVVVLAQQAKEPAMKAAQTALDRQKARRRAIEHAATVREGTVLKTFDPRADHSEPVWVVFSGDDPIAAHPTSTTPIAELIAQQRPGHPGAPGRPAHARRPAQAAAPAPAQARAVTLLVAGDRRRPAPARRAPCGPGSPATTPQVKAERIWGAEGPRWFTPDDPIWRVHADAAMFPGGIRALLLQSLHPLAMAGVAGHSGYKGDPWGRLQRTSEFLATTTFGTIDHAQEQIARVRSIHDRVRGKAADGRPYSAGDPHLLAWVHVDRGRQLPHRLPALRRAATDRRRGRPLRRAERRRRRAPSGCVDPPTTVAELRATIEGYRPELESTAAAREAARFLLVHPPLPLAARPGYAALAAGAVAMLPRWARRPLRLPWLPVTERFVGGRSAGWPRRPCAGRCPTRPTNGARAPPSVRGTSVLTAASASRPGPSPGTWAARAV